jgi:hypothetical protein
MIFISKSYNKDGGGAGRNADFTKDKTSIHDMTFTDATKLKLRHKYNDY